MAIHKLLSRDSPETPHSLQFLMTRRHLEANSALNHFVDKFPRPRPIQSDIELLAKVLVGHAIGKILPSLHLVDMVVSKNYLILSTTICSILTHNPTVDEKLKII